MDVGDSVHAAIGDGSGETDLPSGANPRVRRRTGWRGLIQWVLGRLFASLLICAVGIFSLLVVNAGPAIWNASTTASVVGYYKVNGPDNAKSRYRLVLSVVFVPSADSTPVETQINPKRLDSVYLGQRLPVRYVPSFPTLAIYNGPGGDFAQNGTAGDYLFIVGVLLTAAFSFLTIVYRLRRVLEAAHTTAVAETMVGYSKGQMRVTDRITGKDFEWLLVWGQRKFTGRVFVHGRLERGRWLVARTIDNRLIWPASRAQPVIGTGMPHVPHDSATDLDVLGAHHRLLASYAQVIKAVDDLPLITRCPPGQGDSSWWWCGAPRPVVRGLVSGHLRRRLRMLGDALTRTAVLAEPDDGGVFRRALREASHECRELAGALRRSTLLVLLLPLITIALPIYVAFFPTPHIRFTRTLVVVPYFVWICFGTIVLLAFYHSIRCKRALFSPAIFNRVPAGNRVGVSNYYWDIYRFEREAFKQADASQPRELEGQPWVPWLLGIIYGLTVIVPLVVSVARTEGLATSVRLVVSLLVLSLLTIPIWLHRD